MDNTVINLNLYKQKKKLNSEIAKNRTPLYVSHIDSKVSGNLTEDTFIDRITRIRNALDKINKLLQETKNVN
jgi:hypothetical protein